MFRLDTNMKRTTALTDPADVIAIDFDDPLLAQEAVLATTRLARKGSVEMADAVLVTKMANGRMMVNQTREIAPFQAAMTGSWWLGLPGLIAAGTRGWVIGALVGALIGWLWAKNRDIGIPNAWLSQVADRLSPGHTATVIMLPTFFRTHLVGELRRFRGRLIYSTLDGVDAEEIEDALNGRLG
jgi:uncharacterized membrane protein